MLTEDILRGESKNVEFKVSLPTRSEKYMKSIVAFANCQGGKLIIGVDDVTHEVVGVDPGEVFPIMDAIREMIINAHCHRDCQDEASVQVAIYDDRPKKDPQILQLYHNL